MTSHNEHDVRGGYCGNCHDWTRQAHDALREQIMEAFDLPEELRDRWRAGWQTA